MKCDDVNDCRGELWRRFDAARVLAAALLADLALACRWREAGTLRGLDHSCSGSALRARKEAGIKAPTEKGVSEVRL